VTEKFAELSEILRKLTGIATRAWLEEIHISAEIAEDLQR